MLERLTPTEKNCSLDPPEVTGRQLFHEHIPAIAEGAAEEATKAGSGDLLSGASAAHVYDGFTAKP